MFSIGNLLLAVQGFQTWSLTVPVGTTKEDLEDHKHYRELVSRLTLMDLKPHEYPHLNITDEEGNFFATAVVISNSHQKVKCKVLSFVYVNEPDEVVPVADVDETEQQLKEPGTDETVADVTEPEPDTNEAENAAVETEVKAEVEAEADPEVKEVVFTEEAFEKLKDTSLTHYIKWGAGAKWTIIDKSNGDVLEKNLDNKGAFAAWHNYE